MSGVNRPKRMARLNSEQRRLHEERLAKLLTLSEREDSGTEDNILDVAGLASFVIFDILDKSKKVTDKRREFLKQLSIQLVTRHMEQRSMNPHVSRKPAIKAAMPMNAAQVAASTSSDWASAAAAAKGKGVRRDCVHCNEQGLLRRKSFHVCIQCNKFMCLEHGRVVTTATCNVCYNG